MNGSLLVRAHCFLAFCGSIKKIIILVVFQKSIFIWTSPDSRMLDKFLHEIWKIVLVASSVLINQFMSGILYFFQSPRTGLFSVKIGKKFLAINNFCCQ